MFFYPRHRDTLYQLRQPNYATPKAPLAKSFTGLRTDASLFPVSVVVEAVQLTHLSP